MKKYAYIILLMVSQLVFATGLQPINTDVSVRIQAVDFDLEVRGLYVSGLMNVQFTADSGELNAANLRFPLPTDSVLYKAEIYIPSQEKWVTAETMGRKEGEIIYNRVVEKKEDPLLIQKIGTDFYRARVFPINEQGDLRMRVYYAHTLEEVDDNYQLRIAFANQDSTISSPADGVTISVRTDADYWTAGTWQLEEFGNSTTLDAFGTPSTVNLDDGTAFLNLEDFSMESDIVLPLSSDEPNITSLFYQPEAAELEGHLHVRWHPDFSDYQIMQSKQRNVVFVIDVSGSMSGSKIALTRQAIITSLKALDKNDYFGLVAFSSDVYMFRPTMSKGDDIKTAIEWVANLQSGGGTGMSGGLTAGTSIGVTSPLTDASIDLLVISDGLPNEGSTTVPDILADIGMEADKLNRQIRIFGVGIGADLDQNLLNGLTQQTNGEATFALDDNEITGQILDLFAKVRGGGLPNVTVQIEDMDNNEFNWPYIFSNEVLQIAGKGQFSNQIKLQGRPLNSTPIELNSSFQQLQVNDKMTRIAVPLAAKTWSDQLERQIDETGESNELVNQAVALARNYGIVTRYTSLLALESDELYEKQGVELIKRDPAGIALQPITVSSVDEGRIGGQGTVDSVEEESDDISYSPPGAITSPSIPSYAMDKSNSYNNSTENITLMDSTDSYDDTDYSPTEGKVSIDSYDKKASFGFVTVKQDSVVSAGFSPDILCKISTLDANFQLEIPYLKYQGDYYWANLKLEQGILIVLDYGLIASPTHNSYNCSSYEIYLSDNFELKIPLVDSDIGRITDVVLQGKTIDNSSLIFEIVDYQIK